MKSVYLTLGKPYVYFYIMTAWATGTMQVLSTSILATNRLWAILFPQQLHLWRGRRLVLTVVIQFLPGIVASLPILSYEVSLKESRNGGLIPLITNPRAKAIYFTVAAGFLTVNSVYLILAYSYLFFLIRKRNQIQQKTVSNSRIWQTRKMDLWRKAGFRLFLMASWTVAAEVLYNLYIYSKIFIFPVFHISSEVFYTFYFVLNDLNSGLRAYLLWIFGDHLRHYIYMKLRPRNFAIRSLSSRATFPSISRRTTFPYTSRR
uniref:G_PROTEIN_RECEP_F1_2 domain-containing protein n=1 Tax=Haemonchus contortus TaxID=6289 RepID=A0A7I5EAB2_HAECO